MVEDIVFFFKQKTAYEIYQCDWSSDVCSSDLDRDWFKIRISTLPIISLTGVEDGVERVGIEAGAAYEEAVDAGRGEKFSGVSSLGGTAV